MALASADSVVSHTGNLAKGPLEPQAGGGGGGGGAGAGGEAVNTTQKPVVRWTICPVFAPCLKSAVFGSLLQSCINSLEDITRGNV